MDKVVKVNGLGATPDDSHGLENTGERYLPGAEGTTEQAYDHISRYRLAERYVAGKEVLDMGCGAGYGSHALSAVARGVVGVDLSEEAISYANWRYKAPNLRYGTGDVTDLPYRDGTFEAAVSFEVIEHLPRPEDLVVEAKRLLKDDGVFVVSTPDKQTYRNSRWSKNPHHLKEMYPLEFRELLERHFEHVLFYRQSALAGSIIAPDSDTLSEDGRVSMESAQFSLPDPAFGRGFPTALYLVAVCKDGEAPERVERPYLVLDRDRQIYEEHLDWDVLFRQMEWFHDHKTRALQWRVRQLENQLKQAQNQLHQLRQGGGRALHPREQQVLGALERVRKSRAGGPLRKALHAVARARRALRGNPGGDR